MGEDYINEALELLKLFEGFRERTYLDGNGIPTIGYGFTDPELVKKGRISRAEADRRLLLEARKREVEVRKRIKNWDNLSNGSKSALLSYYYNYPAGFKDTTRFMGYWNKGDYNAAINEVNAGMNDNNNRGLRDRRLKEQEMLRSDPFLFPQKKKTYWDTVSPQEIPMWMPSNYTTQYPLNNTVPESLSSWSGKDSPSKGPRMPSLLKQMDERRRIWDIFENNAVAYGHKKESALPTINKLIDKGKEDFVVSAMNAPSLYGDYSPQYPQLIIPKLTKGKDMPKFKRGKTSIPFKPDDSYDIERAIELGYTPDNAGHMPSRDYETGRILKAPWYETVPKTIIDDLRLGYNMRYNKDDGELYSNTWEGNERWNPELKEELRIPYKKTKQYPHFDPGKDSELVERGGVVYNVDPSAIGASELDVTVPNINIVSNNRPLYQQYDAYNSTYNPNAIRAITDWIPGIGDVSQGFDAVGALNRGDYLNAAMLGAGLVVPKTLSSTAKTALKNLPAERIKLITDNFIKFADKNRSKIARTIKGQDYYNFMNQFGYMLDKNRISADDVYSAMRGRIKKLSLITDPHATYNGDNIIRYNENGIPIGTLSLYDDAGNYNAKHIGSIVSTKPGVGRKLYDSGINSVTQTGYDGIITGEELLSAPKTISTWRHYPTKKLIGKNGKHSNINMLEEMGQSTENAKQVDNGPVYLLDLPSQYVPTKHTKVFDPTILDNRGNMHIDLLDPSIFKAIVPIVGSAALYNSMRDSGILPTQVLADGINEYNKGKNIYIKPSKRGTFTAAAKKRGKSVQGFANLVLSNPGKYSKAMRKKALFARNASKWGK